MALAVLSMAIATFFPAFGAAARNFARMEDRLVAQELANTLLEQQTSARLFKPGVTSGKQGVYAWQMIVTPATEDLAPPVAGGWVLLELVAVVDWAPQRRVQVRTLQLGKLP